MRDKEAVLTCLQRLGLGLGLSAWPHVPALIDTLSTFGRSLATEQSVALAGKAVGCLFCSCPAVVQAVAPELSAVVDHLLAKAEALPEEGEHGAVAGVRVNGSMACATT